MPAGAANLQWQKERTEAPWAVSCSQDTECWSVKKPVFPTLPSLCGIY